MVRQATPVMNPLTDCCGMEYPQSMARTTGKRLLVREVMKRMRFPTLVTYLLLGKEGETDLHKDNAEGGLGLKSLGCSITG